MDRRAYPVLYSLVFGEGILNDAVAVALLGAVARLDTRSNAANHTSPHGSSPASAINPGSMHPISSHGSGLQHLETTAAIAAANWTGVGGMGTTMSWSKGARGSGGSGEDAQDLGMWLELMGSFVWLGGGSMALGVGVGLLSAIIMRHVFRKHRDGDREVRLGLGGTCDSQDWPMPFFAVN